MKGRKICLFVKRWDEDDEVCKTNNFGYFQQKIQYSIHTCSLLRLAINHQRDVEAQTKSGAITKT